MSMPTTYDQMFKEIGEKYTIPWQFPKAITAHESNFKPDARPLDKDGKPIGTATGLMQITAGALAIFNDAAKTTLNQSSLLDPYTNITVGTWLIRHIASLYNSENIPAIKENWHDPIYAGFVALGYTAGWSEDQGVAFIAKRLVTDGKPVTIPNVIDYAEKLFPNSVIYNTGKGYMSDPALLAYVQKVAADYGKMTGLLSEDVKTPGEKSKGGGGGGGGGGGAAALIGLFLGGMMLRRRKG